MSRNSEKPLIQTESLKHQNCETMPSNKKSGSSYHSALQICVVFTFVFVIFLTAKYSSVAIFDVKPEMIRHLAYHDSEVQVDKSRYDLLFYFLLLCRKDSDPRLENLAAISGGKTYFVKDGNLHK